MEEQIQKYKNGLIGIGIYILFVVWIFFAITPRIMTGKTLIGLIISFFFSQYILKPSGKSISATLDTTNIGDWKLFRKYLISFAIASILYILIIFNRDDLGAALIVVIMGVIVFWNLVGSVTSYFMSKDKRFLWISVIFLFFIFATVFLF